MTKKLQKCGEHECHKDCEVCREIANGKSESSFSHSQWSPLS